MNKTFIFIIVLALAGIIAYSNVYDNQFLWDDEFDIVRNTHIKSFSNMGEIFTTFSGASVGRLDNFYRPLKSLAYMLVYSGFGLTPWPYHLLNVLLHIANGVLLFLLIKKIFKKELLAFLASILWLVHPVHTEAITYINGIQDPLMVFFILLALLFYLRFSWWSYLFFAAALLSKESAIIFPALLLLLPKINWKRTIPFWGIAMTYFVARLTILNFGGTLNLYESSNIYTQNIFIRLQTFLASLVDYYIMLIMPVNLHMERAFPVYTSLFSGKVIISLLILAILIAIYKKGSVYKFGIGWFFIAFLPMSGIIPINSLILEHWLYLPSMGFFLIIAYLLQKYWYIWVKFENLD